MDSQDRHLLLDHEPQVCEALDVLVLHVHTRQTRYLGWRLGEEGFTFKPCGSCSPMEGLTSQPYGLAGLIPRAP